MQTQTEENILRSQGMLAKLLDSLPSAIFWKDCNSIYLGCNSLFARWAGLASPEEIIGKSDFDLSWPREQAEMHRASDRAIVEHKQPNYHICELLQCADGTTIWIDKSKIPLADSTGSVYAVLGVCEDITSRKIVEDALHASEERFRGITNNLPGFVYQFYVKDNGERGVHYVDQHASDMFGIPLEPLDTWCQRVIECLVPEDRQRFVVTLEETIRTGSPWEFEGRFITPSGEERFIRDISKPLRLKDETVWNGMLLDVTDRKRAEKKFAKAFRAGPTIMVIARTKDNRFQEVNESFERTTRYRRDEVIGRTAVELNLWVDIEQRERVLRKFVAEGKVRNEECSFRTKDGNVLVGLTSIEGIEIDGEECYLVAIVDITDRKRAEESLRESEQKLKEAQALSHFGYWEWHVTTGEVEWSDEVYKIFQVDPATFVSHIDSILALSPWPEDHGRGKELLQRIAATREGGSYEQRFLRPDSSVGYYESTYQGKFDGQGNLVTIVGTIHDITDRKHTEKLLRVNADRTAALLKLNQLTDATVGELTDFALQEGIRMCESKVGYLAIVNEDETVLTMQSWSRTAMAECHIADKPFVYPVSATGLWGEAVRQRRPIITNDYDAPNPLKKGYPEGHVAIHRHMNIPVIVGSKIVMVAGVGNKEEPYDDTDVQQLTLLMEGVWRLIERRKAEEELNRYRNHLEELVEERTRELNSSRKEALNLVQDANSQRQRAEEALTALRESEEQLRKSELELRLSNEYLARAQAVAHVGHWTWDLVNDRVTGSDEYHRIRGSTPDTLKCYDDVLRTIHPDDREQWVELCRAAAAGEKPYIGDYRVILPDKAVRYVHVQGETTVDENGKPTCMFGAVFDVTDTRIAEQKLKEAMIAAETANRAKSLFLASVSHELRTPLTAVLGFSQLLRDDPTLSESQKEYLDIINRSGTHLLELINDVLDMSKIEAGQLGLQETVFRLQGVLETVAEMMRIRADEKGICFLLDCDPALPRYIQADEKKLKQVLINLAGNAVKFTQQGSVVMKVWMEEDNRSLRCNVEDTGPGISAEYLSTLFDRFVQVGENNEGVGLGLYISRKLVELMGGRISVTSEPGKGSVFSFSIACKPGTLDQAKPELGDRRVVGLAPGQTSPRILVVEDKPETRLFVVKLLETAGFQVEQAENGEEAVKHFETHPADLILMDMRMPIMDGYRATHLIKSTERGKTTPIIALTASAFEEERQRISQAGADDYLGKPIKIEELYEVLRTHLGVAYTYAEQKPYHSAVYNKERLGEMAASLPQELTDRLVQAVSVLDLEGVTAMLPEVAHYAPALSEYLAKLAKGYEVAKLANFFDVRRIP